MFSLIIEVRSWPLFRSNCQLFGPLSRMFGLRKPKLFRGITADDTKYYYVLAALDQDTATRLLDLVNHPPADNKYQTLKGRLADAFGLSKR